MRLSCALLVAVVAGTVVGCRNDKMVLATCGEKNETVIVLPENPSESQSYAAAELSKYLEKMTGVRVPVGRREDARFGIVFRTTDEFGRDGFSLTSRDGMVTIAGSGAAGCLYGAYEFLERLGCRFYWSDFERIPRLPQIAFPAETNIVERPAFQSRDNLYYGMTPEFRAKLRCNRSMWAPLPPRFGGNLNQISTNLRGHVFEKLIPPKKYFKDHPEYFSMVKGKRIGERSQLCLSNPDVFRIVRDTYLQAMRNEPEARVFQFLPNDWLNYCECPACKAVDDAEGSHAGSYIKFLNALAAEVEKEFPQNFLQAGAYLYTRKAPKTLPLRKNILFSFSPVECDWSTSIEKSRFHHNITALRDMREWLKKDGTFTFGDYPTNFEYYPIQFANINGMAGNLRFARDNGFYGFYALGPHDSRASYLHELRCWLEAKLMWNPDQDVWALAREFCNGFYGEKAGPIIYNYVKTVHDRPRDSAKRPMTSFEHFDHPSVTDADLAWALAQWSEAERLVKDDPALLTNVKFGKYSAVFHILMRRASRCCVLKDFAGTEDVIDLIKWVNGFAARTSDPLSYKEHNKGIRKTPFFKLWQRIAEKDPSLLSGRAVLEEKDFKRYQEWRFVQIVDDATAQNGKAIRMVPTCDIWAIQMPLCGILTSAGKKMRMKLRVRVDKTAEARPEDVVLTIGLTNSHRKDDPQAFTKRLRFSRFGDGYETLDLGAVVPSEGEYLWISVGPKWGKDFVRPKGLSNVFVDNIAFEAEE